LIYASLDDLTVNISEPRVIDLELHEGVNAVGNVYYYDTDGTFVGNITKTLSDIPTGGLKIDSETTGTYTNIEYKNGSIISI
jgi:hypothetical protein